MLAENLKKIAREGDKLTTLMIEITYQCNFNCVHCYVGSKKSELYPPYLEQYIRILKQARKMGVFDIAITGGEPFKYEFWRELFLVIKRMNFNLVVFTNATLLNEADICYLKEIGVNLLKISCYGLSKITYEATTRKKGSFDKYLENTALIKKYKVPHVFTNIILSTNEEEAIEMISLNGINRTDLNIMNDYNRSNNPLRYRASTAVINEYFNIKNVNNSRANFDKENDSKNCSYGIDNRICSAGYGSLSIACNGDIYPCSHYRVKLGSILHDSLEEIWASDELKRAREKLNINYFVKCNKCDYKNYIVSVCPGGNFTETGDYYTPSEFKCNMCKTNYESMM